MKFYRYETRIHASMLDELYGSSPYAVSLTNMRVVEMEYSLLRETPKGYWICHGDPHDPNSLNGAKKWISKLANKQFAHLTREEALQAFIKRKERQIKILKAQILGAEVALGEAIQRLEKLR